MGWAGATRRHSDSVSCRSHVRAGPSTIDVRTVKCGLTLRRRRLGPCTGHVPASGPVLERERSAAAPHGVTPASQGRRGWGRLVRWAITTGPTGVGVARRAGSTTRLRARQVVWTSRRRAQGRWLRAACARRRTMSRPATRPRSARQRPRSAPRRRRKPRARQRARRNGRPSGRKQNGGPGRRGGRRQQPRRRRNGRPRQQSGRREPPEGSNERPRTLPQRRWTFTRTPGGSDECARRGSPCPSRCRSRQSDRARWPRLPKQCSRRSPISSARRPSRPRRGSSTVSGGASADPNRRPSPNASRPSSLDPRRPSTLNLSRSRSRNPDLSPNPSPNRNPSWNRSPNRNRSPNPSPSRNRSPSPSHDRSPSGPIRGRSRRRSRRPPIGRGSRLTPGSHPRTCPIWTSTCRTALPTPAPSRPRQNLNSPPIRQPCPSPQPSPSRSDRR